jgi:hypothetical protein
MNLQAGVVLSLALAWWGAFPGSADAQDVGTAALSTEGIDLKPPQDPRAMEAIVSVQGRFSLLSGTVDSSIPAHYNDLFEPGLGVLVEGSLLWPVGPKWHLGPYLSIGWDSYDGKADTDDVGDTLEPDHLDMTTFLVGVRSTYDLGHRFIWESHLGLGASHTSGVDGVFTSAGVPIDVKVFKSSTAFAFDLGTRFAVEAGPVVFDAGIGVRIQGAPKNADFAFDSGSIVSFEVEFGVGLRF